MKYSYQYKRKYVEMYRSGEWPETPDNVQNRKNFRDMIRDWFRIEEEKGPEALRHKGTARKWLQLFKTHSDSHEDRQAACPGVSVTALVSRICPTTK